MTMTWATRNSRTAYSTAAEVPWWSPSGVKGGMRFAMLRWMKNSPESAPKIEATWTRLSQQATIIARGRCPSSARRRYQGRFPA